jgi:hypothetical protein
MEYGEGETFQFASRRDLLPVRQIVDIPQAVRATLGDVAPEIATIVPSLRRAFSDIAPSPELPPDQQRRLVLPSLRLLVVGTYRDVELDVRRPLVRPPAGSTIRSPRNRPADAQWSPPQRATSARSMVTYANLAEQFLRQ